MTKAELRILRALNRGPLYSGAMWICVPMFEPGSADELVERGLVELQRIEMPAGALQYVLTDAGRDELARQTQEVPK